MSLAAAREAVASFQAILGHVAREPVRTPYELARRMGMPFSSAYAAVEQLERMACLARDENGYLMLGERAHQIALDACGFPVRAQRLAPLVRYARDRCGETVFFAALDDRLRVGALAFGFGVHHAPLRPFQSFQVRPASWGGGDALVCLTLEDGALRFQALALEVGAAGADRPAMVICIGFSEGSAPDTAKADALLREVRGLLLAG